MRGKDGCCGLRAILHRIHLDVLKVNYQMVTCIKGEGKVRQVEDFDSHYPAQTSLCIKH